MGCVGNFLCTLGQWSVVLLYQIDMVHVKPYLLEM